MSGAGAKKGSRPWNYGTSKGWVDKRGYRWIYVDEAGKRRARREHRAVMEAHLGRKLEPWELVHHKDENKLNNELGNLEIREFGEHTIEHHKGSRRDDDARRSIEAFARMRDALREERAIKAELYEALSEMVGLYGLCGEIEEYAACSKAQDALAKARGETA